MGLRVTGKRALIRITPEGGTAFDASGVSADGRARANAFSFEIGAQIAEANAYNQAYTEAVPIGQNAASGSLTVFYNAQNGEANAFFETMRQAQHEPGECTDALKYTMEIMPEGECEGKEKWTLEDVVLTGLEFVTPHDNLMIIQAPWRAWAVERELIVLSETTCLLSEDGTASPEVVATYDVFSEDAIAPATTRYLYGVAADATHIYLVYADLSDSTALFNPKILKLPYRDGDGIFSGELSGATWGEVESSHAGRSHEPFACVVDDHYVYVGTELGLFILDKDTLTQVGACEYVGEPWDDAPLLQHVILSACGRYIFGGGSGFGVAVFDISVPTNPTCVYVNLDRNCEYLAYDNERYLFVVDADWGFAVLDMSTPSSPIEVSFSDELFQGTSYHCGSAYYNGMVALGEVRDDQARVQLFTVSPLALESSVDLGMGYDQIFDVGLAGYYLLAFSKDYLGHYVFFNRLGTLGWDSVELAIPGEFRETRGFEHLFIAANRYVIASGPQGYLFVLDACYGDGNGEEE
jgi:hypothetical protein